MKPDLRNPYGYKICYTTKRLKSLYITRFKAHSYKRAMTIKGEYVSHNKRKKKRTWHIIPITKKEVNRGIWKSPF